MASSDRTGGQPRRRAGTAATADAVRRLFGAAPFRVRDAVAAGISEDQVRQAVATGRLTRLRHGWLAVPPDPDADERGEGLTSLERARLEAAVQAAGPDVVVSGRWAASLLGLPVVIAPGAARARRPPVLLLPRGASGREGRRSDGTIVRRARLRDDEIVVVAGLRVTSALRTGIDVARAQAARFGVVPLDAALRRGFPTAARGDHDAAEAARSTLDELVRRQAGTVGIGRARSAAALADPRAESPLESVSRVVIIEGGLPRPVPQLLVRGAEGEAYWGDLGWPRYRLIGECDGWAKYGEADAELTATFRAEKRREDSLRLAGHSVVRWDWEVGVVRPARLLDRVGRALAVAGWAA